MYAPLLGDTQQLLHISEMITKLLDSWKIPETRAPRVVCNNAVNMVAGIEQCGPPSIDPVIHILQLIIKGSTFWLNVLYLTY